MKKSNALQISSVLFFTATSLLWLFLFATKRTEGNLNFLYSFLFGLTPLVGGAIGIFKSRLWGGLSSALGRAVFFVSLGLLLWGLGETIWSYYNFFLHVPAPYPSIADIGFAPSIFFWILGVCFLSVASGAVLAFKRNVWAKVVAVVLPLLLLVVSYFIQVKLARGGVLVPEGETLIKTVLDIAYPFGDFLALIIALGSLILSYRYFGGIFKLPTVAILLGVGVMYFADTVFSYTTTKGTYYNANWGDLLLSLGLFLMTYGILGFCVKPTVNRAKPTEQSEVV